MGEDIFTEAYFIPSESTSLLKMKFSRIKDYLRGILF